jgi:hypothetical protein
MDIGNNFEGTTAYHSVVSALNMVIKSLILTADAVLKRLDS